MKAFWICAVALLFIRTERGFSQTVPCSLERQCTNILLVNSVEECCSQADTLTFRISVDAELCQNCFIYGWVQDIAEDRMSANPQEDIPATPEGEIITLNLYFTKNGPSNVRGLLLDIETSGTATEGVDYTLSRSSNLPLTTSPVPVNVTLLRDGEAGEPLETIILSLVQVNEPDISQILDHQTVQITVQDNDLETGFSVSELTVSESTTPEQVCLMTQGTPATDTTITVTFTPGTAREDDFTLLTQQVMITPAQPNPCVDFIAVADSLGIEGQETLSLSLSGPGNVLFGISTLDITITDADGPVTVGFQEPVQTVSEDAGSVAVLVGIDSDIAVPVTVDVVYNSGSAVEGEDFVVTGVSTVTFTDTSIRSIIVGIMDDPFTESTESFTVELRNPQPEGVIISPKMTTIEILDNDNQIVLRFDRDTYTASEEDRLEIVVEKVGTIDSEVFFAVSGNGINEEHMFEAGASAANSISVFINISDDTIAPELDEMFEVTLSLTQPNLLVAIPDPLATVVVSDRGSITIVGYGFPVYNVSEGTDMVNLCAVMYVPTTGAAPRDFVLRSTIHDGTAVSGIHYTSMSERKLAFHKGTHSVCHTVIITGNRSCKVFYFFATLQYISGMMPIVIDPSTTHVIIDGTNGKECTMSDTTSEDEKDSSSLIIALSVVAVILVLISILAVMIAAIQCVRKRKEKGKDKNKGKEHDSGQISPTEMKENVAYGLSTSEQHTPTIL